MIRSWILVAAALLLTHGSPTLADTAVPPADPEMTCGSEAAKQALVEQLVERLCINDSLKLADLTMSLSLQQQKLTLADLLTTELTQIPLRRTCEVLLSFEATLQAEALGPGPAMVYTLVATGEPRSITYAVGRFDDGRLYVRPAPGCWKMDSLGKTP